MAWTEALCGELDAFGAAKALWWWHVMGKGIKVIHELVCKPTQDTRDFSAHGRAVPFLPVALRLTVNAAVHVKLEPAALVPCHKKSADEDSLIIKTSTRQIRKLC